ncbi:hypothetical protein NA56DRAFT_418970 [Hyaloscypha hepaticicola]|uniref:Uncharacterized protein n=1 Tax=Hyaloscypha hepaticicola TaxID=2082293 RepID=A0A2J6PI17_9HELO|nr:hypothetical protein NA56DRAFT_418970 [Hyaloscypha hepaticicola]
MSKTRVEVQGLVPARATCGCTSPHMNAALLYTNTSYSMLQQLPVAVYPSDATSHQRLFQPGKYSSDPRQTSHRIREPSVRCLIPPCAASQIRRCLIVCFFPVSPIILNLSLVFLEEGPSELHPLARPFDLSIQDLAQRSHK